MDINMLKRVTVDIADNRDDWSEADQAVSVILDAIRFLDYDDSISVSAIYDAIKVSYVGVPLWDDEDVN